MCPLFVVNLSCSSIWKCRQLDTQTTCSVCVVKSFLLLQPNSKTLRIKDGSSARIICISQRTSLLELLDGGPTEVQNDYTSNRKPTILLNVRQYQRESLLKNVTRHHLLHHQPLKSIYIRSRGARFHATSFAMNLLSLSTPNETLLFCNAN